MALVELKSSLSQAKALVYSLLALLCLHTATGKATSHLSGLEFGSRPELIRFLSLCVCVCIATGMSGWGGCLDGQDVFATVRENSLSGEVVAELMAETTVEGIHWSLDGKDADWFFLDERNIRLNTSADKVLDREVNESGCALLNTEHWVLELSHNQEAMNMMEG